MNTYSEGRKISKETCICENQNSHESASMFASITNKKEYTFMEKIREKKNIAICTMNVDNKSKKVHLNSVIFSFSFL